MWRVSGADRLSWRCEVRRQPGSLAVLVAVAAIAGGATMAAAAGARRSDTAYARFRAWSRDADFGTGGGEVEEEVPGTLDRLEEAPFVVDSVRIPSARVLVRLPSGTTFQPFELPAVVDVEGRLGTEIVRTKVLDGRRPDRGDPFEGSISFTTAERYGVGVGDEVEMVDVEGRSLAHRLEIVGIEVRPGELPSLSGSSTAGLMLTPAFAQAFPELMAPGDDALLMRVRPGTTHAEVESFVESLGNSLDVLATAPVTDGIERTIRVETLALWLTAVVIAVVGVVLVGQFLRRHVEAQTSDLVTLRALGLDRHQALRLGMLRGLTLGSAGALSAVAVAVALSPLFPVGLARLADPDVGLHADAAVLGVGAGALLLVVMTLALWTAWRGIPVQRRRAAGRESARLLVPLRASRASVLAGLQFALRPSFPQGRSPARVTLTSLVVVVVALSGLATVRASLDHLAEHRELSGATWDAAIVPLPDEADHYDAREVLARARALPVITATALSNWQTPTGLFVDGRPIDLQVFGGGGSIRPAIRAGRAPAAPGEVALGATVLDQLDLAVGDPVELGLEPGGPTIQGTVVGESVLASPIFFTFAPGDGGTTNFSTLVALGASATDQPAIVLVRFAEGADRRIALDDVVEAVGPIEIGFEAADRAQAVGLERLRTVPNILVVTLGVLAAAGVVHLLLVTTRAKRRDIAILRTLGLTGPQTGTSIVVHALTVVAGALIVGLPLGIVIARYGWTRLAEYLRVVPHLVTPMATVAVIAGGLAVVAIAAATWPARHAMTRSPAEALHAE